MKITLFGKGIRAGRCLNKLVEEGYKPYSVLIDGEDAILESLCETYGIKVLKNPEEILEDKPDLVILISYTKILKEPLISFPTFGMINLHGGKLPEYRGASVLNWQIINGETEGGISILRVDGGIDTGDVLGEALFHIEFEDTIKEVTEKANNLFPSLLIKVIKDIEQFRPEARIQNKQGGTYWHKRNKEDGRILWKDMTAKQIYDLIRGLDEEYPAFTFLGENKINVFKADVLDQNYRGIPGRIVKKDERGIVVIAKDRGLLLEKKEPNNVKIGDNFS